MALLHYLEAFFAAAHNSMDERCQTLNVSHFYYETEKMVHSTHFTTTEDSLFTFIVWVLGFLFGLAESSHLTHPRINISEYLFSPAACHSDNVVA